jgi:hypothetical protein
MPLAPSEVGTRRKGSNPNVCGSIRIDFAGFAASREVKDRGSREGATTAKDAAREAKSAAWKVAIAAEMKRTTTATNQWLARALQMGSPFTVSRLVGTMGR